MLNADNKVIALAFIPWFGDGQAQTCGFAHKGELGKVSALAVREIGWIAGFVEKAFVH